MTTVSLSEMVEKVSSVVQNQSVNTFIRHNNLTISTDVWDFNYTNFSEGYFLFESVTVKDSDEDANNSELRETLMRQYIRKYGITTGI